MSCSSSVITCSSSGEGGGGGGEGEGGGGEGGGGGKGEGGGGEAGGGEGECNTCPRRRGPRGYWPLDELEWPFQRIVPHLQLYHTCKLHHTWRSRQALAATRIEQEHDSHGRDHPECTEMHTDAQECTKMRMGKNPTTFGKKPHSILVAPHRFHRSPSSPLLA